MTWGVDSARTPNSNALDGTVCFDSITTRVGAAPGFWGRYIGGLYAITASEITFLQGRACKILLVYNGTSNSGGSVQGGVAEGQSDANAAADAAAALGAPAGVAIYADIEGPWSPTSDWLRGWATTITARNYVSGYYGDCTPGSNFEQAYCAARAIEATVAGSMLWSMRPEPFSAACQAGAAAPAFAPNTPGCGGQVVLWQYTEDCWEDTLGTDAGIDMDLATDAAVAVMW